MALTINRSTAPHKRQGLTHPTAVISLHNKPKGQTTASALICTTMTRGHTGTTSTQTVWPEPQRIYAAMTSGHAGSTTTQTLWPAVRVDPRRKRAPPRKGISAALPKQPHVPMRLAKAQKKSSTDTPNPANQSSGKGTPVSTTPPPTVRVYGFYRRPSREMPTPAHLRNVTRAAGWDKHTSEHWSLPNYMDRHARLNYRMRTILVDWLASVTERFRLSENTFNLAVTLLDRTLACVSSNGKITFTVKREAYQCYGW